MGRHETDDDRPGRDTLFPRHSIEEREADTGTMTSVDLQRQLGILPRSTPPQGFAPRVVARAPERGRRASSGGQGRSVDPSPWGRVVVALVLVGILVTVILALRGW